jgi:hypothetical protein
MRRLTMQPASSCSSAASLSSVPAQARKEYYRTSPSPRQLDLLQYQNGRAALLLDGVTLPAGDYEWIRLIVDNEPAVRDSYVVLTDGQECELRVPSGGGRASSSIVASICPPTAAWR